MLGLITDRFEQMVVSHQNVCGFLYKFNELGTGKKELLAHSMDLQIALTESQQSDINVVDLANELEHLRYIIPSGKNTLLTILQYIY